MKKKRSDRMRKLAELARTEERRECERMGRAQQALDQEIRRLDELTAYRREYTSRFDHAADVSPVRWQDYQNFLRRIDQAARDLEQQIQAGRDARDAHRRRWLVKRQKLESLESVVDRYRRNERHAEERKQQKAIDDLAVSGGTGWNRNSD